MKKGKVQRCTIRRYFFFGFFLLLAFFFAATALLQGLEYLTIAKATFPRKSFRRHRLPAVGALSHFCFRHPLWRVKDVVIVFQVAQERYSVVDIVSDYQVAPAVAAFYDMLVRTGLRQYRIWLGQLE